MKKILSTTGEPIEFAVTADRNVLIDPVTPIEVSEEDYALLDSRLGAQISTVEDEESSEEVDETATGDEKSPILKTYKVISEDGIIVDGANHEKDEEIELDSLEQATIDFLTEGDIEEVTPEA